MITIRFVIKACIYVLILIWLGNQALCCSSIKVTLKMKSHVFNSHLIQLTSSISFLLFLQVKLSFPSKVSLKAFIIFSYWTLLHNDKDILKGNLQVKDSYSTQIRLISIDY